MAKLTYLKNLGNKMHDKHTSQKLYWKIIQKVMNKCRAPKIPPILVNGVFVMLSRAKAIYFNEFFTKQCKLIINNSVLPLISFFTNKRIDHVPIELQEINLLLRNINSKKVSGSDEISGQMLLLCGDSIGVPLHIIFNNILTTSVYPDTWKIANVTPIFKKGDKQIMKNYRPISLLPLSLLTMMETRQV